MIDLKEEPTWARVGATHDVDIKTEVVRKVNGVIVISKKGLADKWHTTPRNIQRYVAKGMPIAEELCITNFSVYPLKACEYWKELNLDKTKSLSKSNAVIDTLPEQSNSSPEEPDEKHDAVRKQKADADKAEHEAVISELKKKKLDESLIDSESLDIAQAELAAIFITNYINDKKLLQVLLKRKESHEIKHVLEQHYKKRIEDLDKLVNKVFDECDNTAYEVMQAVLTQMGDGVSPDELIKRINVSSS